MEMERNLLKGVLKAWLDSAQRSGVTPEQFSEIFMNGIFKYVGTCPVKLMTLMELFGEATDELVAEELGNAVPNVKLEGAIAGAPRFNSDNYD